MPRIFISYRREDTIAYAGRIYDRLVAEFGRANVFMDIDTLEPGVDFVEVLQRTVGLCDVLLAVIGRQWLTLKDEDGRPRISHPEDFVALEIAAGLERQTTRVVPVLVGGAAMPRSTDLPERLANLTRRHAVMLPDIGFHQTLGGVIKSIERGGEERRRGKSIYKMILPAVSLVLVLAALVGGVWWSMNMRKQSRVAGTERAPTAEKKVAGDLKATTNSSPRVVSKTPPSTGLPTELRKATDPATNSKNLKKTPPPDDLSAVFGRGTEATQSKKTLPLLPPPDTSAKVSPGIVYNYTTIGQYRSAIAQKPNDADLREDYAGALEQLGDLDGAVEQFRIATTLPPKVVGRAFLYRDYATALEKKGDLEGAVAAAQKSLISWPTKNERRCLGAEEVLAGRLLERKGDLKGALAMWQETKEKEQQRAHATGPSQCDAQIQRIQAKMK